MKKKESKYIKKTLRRKIRQTLKSVVRHNTDLIEEEIDEEIKKNGIPTIR
jgi:hypothetical protein